MLIKPRINHLKVQLRSVICVDSKLTHDHRLLDVLCNNGALLDVKMFVISELEHLAVKHFASFLLQVKWAKSGNLMFHTLSTGRL